MATTEQAETEQCRALTDDDVRCSRPAQEDGFCYQHDESDPTVDEAETDDGSEDGGGGESGGSDGEAEQSADADAEAADDDAEAADDDAEAADDDADRSADEGGEQSTDAGGEGTDGDGGEESTESGDRTVSEEDLGESDSTILGVRRTVEGTATGLIGQPLDSITEVTATEDGWRAIVEVVERSSVPDTQDILGQYEIELSDDIEVQGYRRIDRYRRSDTDK